MNLDDLKERFSSESRQLWERIQESAAYNQLRDRYENLTPAKQKLTVAGVVALIVMLILSMPYSSFTQSADSEHDFEEKRNTIRELLKVSRESSEIPDIAQPPSIEALRSNVENLLKSANLLPEQIKGSQVGSSSTLLIPANLSSGQLQVSLAKLNLRQIVDLGYQIQSINPSVKVKDMLMQANREDSRYFDVVFKLVALAVPAPQAAEPPAGSGSSGNDHGRRRKAPKKDDQ